MQVEFLGRMQKQEQDDAWYTCINYISVCGMPVYGFIPAQLHLDWPDISASLDKPRGLLLRKVGASGLCIIKAISPFFGWRCKFCVPLESALWLAISGSQRLNVCISLSFVSLDPFYNPVETSA